MGPHPGCLEFRPPPFKHKKTVAPRTQTGCWVAAKNDQWSLHAWVSQWSVRARLETVQESLTKEDSLQSVGEIAGWRRAQPWRGWAGLLKTQDGNVCRGSASSSRCS